MKRTVEGAPAFVGDQRTEILRLLRDAGQAGVSKAFLVFEKHYTQAAARIWELERQGYQILHESRKGERYVRFVLVSEPTDPQPKTADWYEETTGKPRTMASKHDSPYPKPLPAYRPLPLFDGVEAV